MRINNMNKGFAQAVFKIKPPVQAPSKLCVSSIYPHVLHALMDMITECTSWRLRFDITQKHQHATIEPGISTANALIALSSHNLNN